MNVSFVIPFYNHWDLVHQLLWDIHTRSRDVDDVVVVNDASTEAHGLAWWQDSKLLPIRVVSMTQNEGFLRAANRGMQAALGDAIVLISNDVRVHQNLAGVVRSTLKLSPKILMGGRYLNQSTGWNDFNGRIFKYMEGWLLAATKQTWEDLGYFDERYSPCDYEDVDLSTTALSKGYDLVELPSMWTEHLVAQSMPYGPERQKITEANREKFRQKWIP